MNDQYQNSQENPANASNSSSYTNNTNNTDFSSYQTYQDDIHKVWIYNLNSAFYKINNTIKEHTGKRLEQPNFAINPNMNYRWAEWNQPTRTITFSLKLLRNYEWNAIIHVLKHETAHIIVDEIFNTDTYSTKPHGILFANACTILDIDLDIDPKASMSNNILASFKGGEPHPIVEKIRKLLVHGNDKSISKEEAELFLNKAQTLMLSHNIAIHDVQGDLGGLNGLNKDDKSFYTFRPVGPTFSTIKSWMGSLAGVITECYNVKAIWMGEKNARHLEFFGAPDNLDVAEYVFHAILNQAEALWNDYYTDHKTKLATDPQYVIKFRSWGEKNNHRISKNAFITGIIDGYASTLSIGKKAAMANISPNDHVIMIRSSKLLEEAYDKKYHPRKIGFARSSARGYNDGYSQGKGLTLNQAVKPSTVSNCLQLSPTVCLICLH